MNNLTGPILLLYLNCYTETKINEAIVTAPEIIRYFFVKMIETKRRQIRADLLQYMLRPRGHAVGKLVKALRYKPEGRGFDAR